MPESLCNLYCLQHLNLSYNFGLRGWIPEGLGDLVNLKTLHLYSAMLSGEKLYGIHTAGDTIALVVANRFIYAWGIELLGVCLRSCLFPARHVLRCNSARAVTPGTRVCFGGPRPLYCSRTNKDKPVPLLAFETVYNRSSLTNVTMAELGTRAGFEVANHEARFGGCCYLTFFFLNCTILRIYLAPLVTATGVPAALVVWTRRGFAPCRTLGPYKN